MRWPVLRFLLIGAVLFFGRALTERWSAASDPPPTVVSSGTSDEDLLVGQALARGFDRDAAVRRRLARLGQFVGEESGDEARLEQTARALGLERGDLVVRRHLAQMMQLASAHLGPSDLPSEAEASAYLVAHADAFTEPGRIDLVHVFLRREGDPAQTTARAATMGASLRACGGPPACTTGRGDAFLYGSVLGPATVDELTRLVGADVAQAAATAPPDEWVGPVASAYGLHFLWVRARTAPMVPPLAAVRGRVLHAMLRERGDARARAHLDAWREAAVVARAPDRN